MLNFGFTFFDVKDRFATLCISVIMAFCLLLATQVHAEYETPIFTEPVADSDIANESFSIHSEKVKSSETSSIRNSHSDEEYNAVTMEPQTSILAGSILIWAKQNSSKLFFKTALGAPSPVPKVL